MKKIVYTLVLVICFSCSEGKQESPIFIADDEVVEPNDSITFHKELNSKRETDNKQLFAKYFKPNKLDSLYVISSQIKPNFLFADFNGDDKEDFVCFVRNVWDNKGGLIFFHSRNEFHIVGAGNNSSALDNIYYTNFEVDKSKLAFETIVDSITGDIMGHKEILLKNISLHMAENEGTSGLLTWNGEKYIYIHTGD